MLPNDLLLHRLQHIFYLVRTNRSSFYIHLFSRTSIVKDGLVYIFLHETRTSEDLFRDRTKTPTSEHPDSDKLKLREVFSSRTCKTFRNRTKEEIFKKIKGFTQSHDVFVFVFLSYLWCDKNKTEGGNKVRIECRHGCFTLGELFEATKNQPCLVGKSNIFLTQTDDVQLLSPGTPLGSTPLPDAAKTIPSDTNQLIIWSTLPQGLTKLTKAARNQTRSGKWHWRKSEAR